MIRSFIDLFLLLVKHKRLSLKDSRSYMEIIIQIIRLH
jgi:hypothetical protein